MYVIDLNGNEYALQATSTSDSEVNGNQSFSCVIPATRVNGAFINEITEMWEVVDHDGVIHKIVYAKKNGEGNRLTVEIKAIPLFYDTLDNDRIYERIDEHMTAQVAFGRIFANTGFGFVIVDSLIAVDWEGFGEGETKLESFKRALARYKCEFEIVGNTVNIRKLIGRDTQFMYRYRLNASNIVQEIDANELWTYAIGYGDYEDDEDSGGWENANLVREYTSPLAQVLGIRHAPPTKDGRVKIASSMDESLKTLVDGSLKISVSADIHDLRKQGYPLAQSVAGDRVFLIDERIGLNDEVRVVAQSLTRDWRGNVIDLSITFGSEEIAKRHQANMQTAIKNITDLLEGTKKLPYSVIDEAILRATQAIKNAQTELVFPENGGIWGIDRDDPNYVTGFTSRGVMVSIDGGATAEAAITGDGVVAQKLFGNIIIGQFLNIENSSGKYTLDNDGFTIQGGSMSIVGGLDDNNIAGSGRWNGTSAVVDGNKATWDKATILNSDGTLNVDLLKGKLTDTQLASASKWNGQGTYIDNTGVYTGVVVANQLVSGTLDTGNVRVRGGTSTEYTQIDGSYLESRGKYVRDWRGTKETEDVSLRLQNGQFRARNNNKNWSLYLNDYGLSTFSDGDGGSENNASGIIEFHSSQYSNDGNASGLTLLSLAGRIGLETDSSRIYLNPSGASVRVSDLYDNYYSIAASNFTQSSESKLKRDVKPLQDDATALIKSLDIVEYKRLTKGEATIMDTWQAGLILEDAPLPLTDGTGIDLYSYISFTARALQEVIERIEELEEA